MPSIEQQCPCGFDKSHPHVEAKHKYSLWGWFLLSMGISAKALEILYYCRRCKTVVERDLNPGV